MNLLVKMLPTLGEATSGTALSTKLLENSGNIMQWCVTFAGIGTFFKTIAATK